MAHFQIVKAEYPEYGPIISEADNTDELDYSKLHDCRIWSIWVTCDDGHKYRTAYVNWEACNEYKIENEFDKETTIIQSHRLIIPVVRGIIIYNDIFQRYRKFNPNIYVSVRPIST